MKEDVLGIGWDVGSWLGTRRETLHCAALVAWRGTQARLFSLGRPVRFETPRDGEAPLKPMDIVRRVLGEPDAKGYFRTFSKVVVAVNAPLGFPSAFVRLARGRRGVLTTPSSDIEHPMAYRETDRHVARLFGRRPLSTVFGSTGMQATLALGYARAWQRDRGFALYPMDAGQAKKRIMVEVLPALLSTAEGRGRRKAEGDPIHPRIARLLPELSIGPGRRSLGFDAYLCALMAVSLGVRELGGSAMLPPIEGPPQGMSDRILEREGWIYHVPPEWLNVEGKDSSPSAGNERQRQPETGARLS